MNKSDIFNEKKQEREILRYTQQADFSEICDQQVWYDSLRETDDGRYSQRGLNNCLSVWSPQQSVKKTVMSNLNKSFQHSP